MSICNHCRLKALERVAKRNNMRVLVRASASDAGGTDVYVVSKSIKIPKDIRKDSVYRKMYWRAWYVSLTERCAC